MGNGCPQCYNELRKSGKLWNENSSYGLTGFYRSNNNISNIYLINVDNRFLKVGLTTSINSRISRIKKELDVQNVSCLFLMEGKAKDLWHKEQSIHQNPDLKDYNDFALDENFSGISECYETGELEKLLTLLYTI